MAYMDRRTVAAAGAGKLSITIDRPAVWDTAEESDRLSAEETVLLRKTIKSDREEWLTRAWSAKKAAARLLGGASNFAIARVNVENGEFTVTAESSKGHNESLTVCVSTVRDGDHIISLAYRENHENVGQTVS